MNVSNFNQLVKAVKSLGKFFSFPSPGVIKVSDTLVASKLKIEVRSWNNTDPKALIDGGTLLVAGGQHTSTFFGINSMKNADPNNYFQNSAFGFASMQSLSGGNNNDAFGGWCMGQLTTGTENACFGRDGLGSLSTGSGNVAIGTVSGYTTTTGSGNIFVGRRTGWGITTGNSNIVIGDYIQNLPATLTNTTILGGTESRDNICKVGRSTQRLSVGAIVSDYADNAAAKAAGLANGDVYRTGDLLKVVHD